MYSSRMHTARSLPLGRSLCLRGSLSREGGLCLERGSLSRGVSVQGVSVQGGLYPERPPPSPPPVDRKTSFVGGNNVQFTHSLRARSYCDDSGIIFIILVSSNADVTNRYCGTKWRCSDGNGI